MPYPTPLKRLLTVIYDSFLVLATLFIATALTMPLTKGEVSSGNNIYMSIYLSIVVYIFYAWFWTHGGQTLGMRAWKLQLVRFDNYAVTWKQSFIRYITALPAWVLFLIGIVLWIKPEFAKTFTSLPGWSMALVGLFWIVMDSRKASWRNEISGTQVVSTETI